MIFSYIFTDINFLLPMCNYMLLTWPILEIEKQNKVSRYLSSVLFVNLELSSHFVVAFLTDVR